MSKSQRQHHRDRALGAYLGAAIGDAMGGPVECQHAARIRRIYGEIRGLLPYRAPPGLIQLKPGYALHPEPGSITDDTFIRADLTRFYLDTTPPRTPDNLAAWMLENADFRCWWPPAVEALQRVARQEATASEGGLTHRQGGGVGWWTPVGILHAGDPDGAAAEARSLCRIWKAPLEQDLLAAVQAGVAQAMLPDATVDGVVQAILAACGPLARRLLMRAIAIAHAATGMDDLVQRLYRTVIIDEPQVTPDADGPLPAAPKLVMDSDERYSSALLAEQIPLAIAAFIHGDGDPRRAIPAAVMMGRDCDTTATTVGSWVGALRGERALPPDWVDAVYQANQAELDLRGLAARLADLSARMADLSS